MSGAGQNGENTIEFTVSFFYILSPWLNPHKDFVLAGDNIQ